jgi:hypothetical protein
MGDAGDSFAYIAQRVTIGPPGDDQSSLIAAAKDTRADIIVLDTLSRTFGVGDQLSAKDMCAYIDSIDTLRTETGAHVAVIHHGTKDDRTARGSNALEGAADLIVKVSRDKDSDSRVASVEGAKDDADGAQLPFRLQIVNLTAAEDGMDRETCVAEQAESGKRPESQLPPTARHALRYLSDLIVTEGKPLPYGALYPPNMKGVPEKRWRDECETRRLSMADSEEDRSRVFRSAAKTLREASRIAMREGLVWVVRSEDL